MVIAIIGVLASVVLASLNTARSKARDAQRLSDIRTLQTAIEAVYTETGQYPSGNWQCSGDADWQTFTLSSAISSWLPQLPTDPTSNTTSGGGSYPWNGSGNYGYCYFGNTGGDWLGQAYMVVFLLENRDFDLDAIDGVTNCSGSTYNYDGEDGYVITLGTSC